MKRFLILISFIVIVCGNIFATSTMQSANEAYKNEHYEDALSQYQNIAESQGLSSDLMYNIGNAHYRLGHTAQAILAYERALRLDPSNADARTNLEFVNSRIIDKKGETGSFIYNKFVDIVSLMSSNSWAWIAALMFLLTGVALTCYLNIDAILVRKIGFFGGIVTFTLTLASLVFAFKAKNLSTDDKDAIITSQTTMLSTVPRQPQSHDEEAMQLHEGTKVRILRSIDLVSDSLTQTWHEVEIDNRHRAWINSSDIEKIALN